MTLKPYYFYSRRRYSVTIAPALGSKKYLADLSEVTVHLYNQRLTPTELGLLFPTVSDSVVEHTLMCNPMVGKNIEGTFHPSTRFYGSDIDLNVTCAKWVRLKTECPVAPETKPQFSFEENRKSPVVTVRPKKNVFRPSLKQATA